MSCGTMHKYKKPKKRKLPKRGQRARTNRRGKK